MENAENWLGGGAMAVRRSLQRKPHEVTGRHGPELQPTVGVRLIAGPSRCSRRVAREARPSICCQALFFKLFFDRLTRSGDILSRL